MRLSLRRIVPALLLLAGVFPCGAQENRAPVERTLTILHTNDLHGHILPFAYTEEGRSKVEQPSVGGAARRATLIRQLRKQIKNPVVLVDAGDTFTRGPFTNAYEGVADVEAMNALGYEMAAIGNNEFKAKDGTEVTDAAGSQSALLRVIKRARFPWLCANTTDGKGALLEGVQPFVVREWEGLRIGFLGLTAPRSASYPQTKGWSITDPIAAAKVWIPKARKECDILIAVTHIGFNLDKRLAAETTGLDAIVGGDSHTFLYKAVEVANLDGVRVPIVQDGEFGVNLGRFDLAFTQDGQGRWRLASYRYELLPIGPKLAEAPDVAEVIKRYARPLTEQVLGRVEKIGATPEERSRLTTQVIADALRRQTRSDFALNPDGGGMFDVFRRPVVTLYDLRAILPFKNNVVTVELTGAEIEALRQKEKTTVISGDLSHLTPPRTYRVAFIDFIAVDSYQLPTAKLKDTGRDVREMIADDLRTNSERAVLPAEQIPIRFDRLPLHAAIPPLVVRGMPAFAWRSPGRRSP